MADRTIHVFLTTELFYPDLPGGMMRFFRYGPGFVKRGIIPHVITLHHKPGLADEEEVNGIRIHRLHPPSSSPGPVHRPWLLKQAYRQARDILGDGGVAVLQPSSLSHLMIFTFFKARLQGLACVHNASIVPEKTLSQSPFVIWRRRLLMGATCAPLNKLIFLSQEMCRLCSERMPLRPSQKTIIPNGVDLDRFRPISNRKERGDLRREMGFSEDAQIVLFVGGLMARKGVDILLQAWGQVLSEHPNAKLVILGSGSGRPSHQRPGYADELNAYLKTIENLHSRLPNPESVVFAGEVDDPAPYYRIADIFAFPSRREGLPNAVLEAMACGLPCLVARFEGCPADGEELGFEGQHHFLLGHDVSEWTAELVDLLQEENTKFRQKVGHQARKWIENHFCLSRVLDQWTSLYRQLTVTKSIE